MQKALTSPQAWRQFFSEVGLREDVQSAYVAYVAELLKSRVPVIFDFRHLASLLGRTPEYLASAVNGTTSHYRRFTIPKRSGGRREINVPYPALLECQDWIRTQILVRLKVHDAAYGFVRRRNILQNATLHHGSACVLRIDIRDFFPSIKLHRVIEIFQRLGYSNPISVYLARLCTVDDVLPQGASTSPGIANIVAYKLDRRLARFAARFALKYSRYADDLTFSGEHIPIAYVSYIEKICESEGFQINQKKTRLIRAGGRKIVTGVDITHETVRVPRSFRRKVRQEAYYVLERGLLNHAAHTKQAPIKVLLSLIGKYQFWLSIEPNNRHTLHTYGRLLDMRRKFGDMLQAA